MEWLSSNLKSRCTEWSSITTAIEEVLSSVSKGAKELTFAQIVDQMGAQVPILKKVSLIDEGNGEKYAEIVTAAMDNYLELAALVTCLKNGDNGDMVTERRNDIELMLHNLSEFWHIFIRMSLVELIDPFSAAGQEQTLSLEKLQSEQLTSAIDKEESLSDEKKARVLVAKERNAVLAAAVDVCFQALLYGSMELLALKESLNICNLNADESYTLISMIIMAMSISVDKTSAESISAVDAEARQPHEEMRQIALGAASSRRMERSGVDANRNQYSFHVSTARVSSLCYTSDIAPFVQGTGLSRVCCDNSGDSGRDSMVKSLLATVAASHADVTNSESESTAEGNEEKIRSGIFAKLAKLEHSLTGEGSKGEDKGASSQAYEAKSSIGGGIFGQMRRHGRMKAIYGVFAQSYLLTLRSATLAAYCGGAFSTSTGVMLATAAPLALRMLGEPDDHLKCLGALLLKRLLDSSPSGLVLAAQGWLLPEVYHQWEACEEITRSHREGTFKMGLLEGKVGSTRDDGDTGAGQGGGERERALLYMASLLQARLLHGLLCGSTTASGGTGGQLVLRFHHRYLESLLHKVRLHVSSPAAVWCYLSQSSAYLCHHQQYQHFQCPERLASALGTDPLSEESHSQYIASRLKSWSSVLDEGVTSVATPSAAKTGLDDPSLFLMSTMAGQVVETMVGLLHDCCHAAVHYHCLQWLGTVLVALAVQTRAQDEDEDGKEGAEQRAPGAPSAGERQIHLTVVPELLRLFVFYHSQAQDLWLTLPDSQFDSDNRLDNEGKRLKRGVVVAEAYSLLAFILRRHEQRAQATAGSDVGMSLKETVRVMAAAVCGEWGDQRPCPPASHDAGHSVTLLQRLPASLWK